MMKSFFKKLAFVMALAMVVTMAAPAGTAALAADLYVAYQGKTEAITEVTLEKVGDKADLCFKNAPKNWKDDFSWTSADTTVATVDEAGVIVAKKVGTTVVTCQVLGEEVDVKVTVGKVVEADAEYEVKQLTATTIAVNFDGKHSYKAGDITLYYVLEGENENYNVVWPIKNPKVTDTGFEVEPYVPFEDGNTYVLTFGDQEPEDGYEFTTEFGYPDTIDLSSFSSHGKVGKAYATTDDDKDDVLTSFNIKLLSGDVDVTALYINKDGELIKDDTEFEFVVEWTDDAENVEIDDETGNLVFTKPGVSAIVTAKFTMEDKNGEPVYATGVTTTPITSEVAPAYKLVNVEKWTIIKNGTSKIDWSKCVHDIKAYDDTFAGEYKIVALVLDNYGNVLVTDKTFADPTNAYGFGKILSPDTEGSMFYEGDYKVAFRSADVAKLLVGVDGSLTTYAEADVPVIVSLYQEDYEEENFIKHVSALPVEVEEARYIKKITADVKTIELATDDKSPKTVPVKAPEGTPADKIQADTGYLLDDEGKVVYDRTYEFCKGKIEVTLKDQHGDVWTKATDVTITTDIDNVSFPAIKYTYDATYNTGKATLNLDGHNLAALMGKEDKVEVTFTVKVNDAGKKESCEVKVELEDPDYKYVKNENNEDVKTDEIVRDDFGLTATNANQKWTETYGHPTENKVTFSQFSNKLKVAVEGGIRLYDATKATNKEYTVANGYTEGDKFLIVLDPNGNVVRLAEDENDLGVYQGEDGVFHVVVATKAAQKNDKDEIVRDETTKEIKRTNEIVYLPTGEYTAKVINIKSFDKDTKLAEFRMKNGTGDSKVHVATFEVTNDSKSAAFVAAKTNFSDSTTAKQVVVDTLLFSLGGAEWAIDVDDIAYVKTRYNKEADYVIITAVVLKVPVDGKVDSKQTQYFLQTVPVNKAIELDGDLTEEN